MSGRDQILGAVRRSLKRQAEDGAAKRVAERLAEHPRGPVPARAQLPHKQQVALFQAQAEAVQTTVDRLADLSEVPKAISAYLSSQNLPQSLRVAPDDRLAGLPWQAEAPLLQVGVGRAEGDDAASLTPVFAAVAETGTLMLRSGPETPVTLNFLPETHIAVVFASQIVGSYEDAWQRFREAGNDSRLPRTVNFITGPSRTGDIEQTILFGAHGPKRLHLLLVDDVP